MIDRRKQIDEVIVALSDCITGKDEELAAIVALGILNGLLKDIASIAESLKVIANRS